MGPRWRRRARCWARALLGCSCWAAVPGWRAGGVAPAAEAVVVGRGGGGGGGSGACEQLLELSPAAQRTHASGGAVQECFMLFSLQLLLPGF